MPKNTNTTTKLTGPQITALKHKFVQLLKDGVRHQHEHYEAARKVNQGKAHLREDAIRAKYQPAITDVCNKIDALCDKKRDIERERDTQVRAECDKLFGPQPRFGYYQAERLADEHWVHINFKLQFTSHPDAESMLKMLSDEVVKILNDKR